MTFHDLCQFSMQFVKQLFSKYYENNLLFKVFSHIMMHRMQASVILLVELEPFFWCLLFLKLLIFFVFLFSETILLFHDIQWPKL